MTYNQILKQRRQALQLSIQDIQMQTNLDANFVQAIEENNLEKFKGDISYIRYFTKQYCEIIGVNYEAISPDVEANLAAYSSRITSQPVKKPVTKTTTSTNTNSKKNLNRKKSKKKSKKSYSKNKYVQFVQKLFRSKYGHIYQIVAAGLAIILVLSIVNAGLSWRSNRRLAQEEQERQTEIKQKEKETAQLANQKDSTDSSSSSNVKLTATDKDNNVYSVSGVVGDANEVTITITLPSDSTVAIYKDDELVTDNADKTYSGTFKKTIKASEACLLQVEIGTFSTNKVRLDGKSVSFSKTNWTEGSPAVFYFDILDADGNSSQDSTTSSSSTSTTDTSDASTYYDYDYSEE